MMGSMRPLLVTALILGLTAPLPLWRRSGGS